MKLDLGGIFIKVFLILWQLPQIIAARIYRLFLGKPIMKYKYPDSDITVIIKESLGCVSLGDTIFISRNSQFNTNTIRHEYGHTKQSKYLGWLYLIVIGIPSITYCGLRKMSSKLKSKNYYKFYTEAWADKLGDVHRNS